MHCKKSVQANCKTRLLKDKYTYLEKLQGYFSYIIVLNGAAYYVVYNYLCAFHYDIGCAYHFISNGFEFFLYFSVVYFHKTEPKLLNYGQIHSSLSIVHHVIWFFGGIYHMEQDSILLISE